MAGTKVVFLVGYLLSGALCSDFSISMPKRIEALSGSCVLIPCTFNVPDADVLKNSASGIWIKSIPQFKNAGATVVFNSSKTNNILSGEIVGDLVQKNCTTVLDKITEEYTDKYYFRIETTSNFKATFVQTPVNIFVTGSPRKPSIQKAKELNESTPVGLKCVAAAPCSKQLPVLAWTPSLGNTRRELQENSDKTKSVLNVLTFTPSHIHHGKNITCSAEYTLQNGNKIKVMDNMTLNVLFPPKNTVASISPPGPLLNGSHVTLTCNSSANPPVKTFTWFRITWFHTTERGSGETLTFNVSSDDVGWYYCEAQNQQGKQESTQVKLTVDGVWDPFPMIGAALGTCSVLLACSLLLLFWRLRNSRKRCACIRITSSEEQQSSDPSNAVNTRENQGKDPSNAVNARENQGKDPSNAVPRERTAVLESQHEEVHYAEISNLKAKEKGKRDKENGQGQEIEYAEVRFPERKRLPIEDIYAKVNPKHHS